MKSLPEIVRDNKKVEPISLMDVINEPSEQERREIKRHAEIVGALKKIAELLESARHDAEKLDSVRKEVRLLRLTHERRDDKPSPFAEGAHFATQRIAEALGGAE